MLIGKSKIAKKYARAFLRAYPETDSVDFLQALKHFSNLVEKNTMLQATLSLPSLSAEEKLKLIKLVVKESSLTQSIENLLLTLVQHHRIELLAPVLKKIIFLAKQQRKEKHFTVTSSCPLSKTEKLTVENFILESTEGQIATDFICDKALISGIRIKSDTLFWERSIAKHLSDVKHALLRQEKL